MNEELQKRITDCVYFLASPLTCKKGLECEYRHSEIARLNPRDCWYWLAGSCLNPTCVFRHPPLDGCTEASSVTAQPQYESSVPVNKTNVPCYFFFNGFCNKGDRCSFLHGPDDGTPAWKSLKTDSTVTNTLPLEHKTFAGNDTVSAPIETNSCENAPKKVAEMQIKPADKLPELVPDIVTERSASPHISVSECEEAAALSSDPLLALEDFDKEQLTCMDQSSEEQVDHDHIEREEWLESSPGFDVLVDDRSENLGYEDDLEYVVALDGEDRELNSHFAGYDYEDLLEYDTAYPDAGTLYDGDIRSTYDHLDDESTYVNVSNIPTRSRERMLDSILPRKFFPADLVINGRRDVDLRDHLKERRMIDGHLVTTISRRFGSTRLTGRSREGFQRRHARRLHGKLALGMENSVIRSHVRSEILLNSVNKRGRFKETRINMSRQPSKEKRKAEQQFLSSEVSRNRASKKRNSVKNSSMFEGPKTLAEIKEEKMKARGNGNSYGEMGHSSRTSFENFQGPKPLSEILKDKKRG